MRGEFNITIFDIKFLIPSFFVIIRRFRITEKPEIHQSTVLGHFSIYLNVLIFALPLMMLKYTDKYHAWNKRGIRFTIPYDLSEETIS